jgi:hypothetical protein
VQPGHRKEPEGRTVRTSEPAYWVCDPTYRTLDHAGSLATTPHYARPDSARRRAGSASPWAHPAGSGRARRDAFPCPSQGDRRDEPLPWRGEPTHPHQRGTTEFTTAWSPQPETCAPTPQCKRNSSSRRVSRSLTRTLPSPKPSGNVDRCSKPRSPGPKQWRIPPPRH